ncbi:MAG: DUF262 domain-containing HNH endonuclease family protein [Spirochaetaceae bacterium]|jgi:uncharacterized protein with ParB-like and HNH nuclease domain|nr:DUF262 domain-containing HNH endonuclease family protein [Spirochaetaceae bacterium]
MDASTNVKGMLYGNKIRVPNYQRAYSWNTPSSDFNGKTHTDIFLKDLENHIKSGVATPYYFGHFLFEEKSNGNFDVIDGQQRLTTIIIFLSALFTSIKSIRNFTDDEKGFYENMIHRGANYAFSTVDYDDQFFKDYVINQTSKSKNNLETDSAKRIANAFDYFVKKLSKKENDSLDKVLQTIIWASCTTHLVKHESEAIQMFIFQNDRGKDPTKLEIIKAQFMYSIHLYGDNEADTLIEEIKNRFEKIYKSIASIEHRIDEDIVLLYTLRVYYNSLWETKSIEKINSQLNEKNPIQFIREFSQYLEDSFNALMLFFGDDEKNYFKIHSLICLDGLGVVMPFVIKAYIFSLSKEDLCRFCAAAESLILRHRLIGTRADIVSRLNDVYKEFTNENPDIEPTIERIIWMKEVKDWWWAYWNTKHLEEAINGGIEPATAKYLLWKYENYLASQGHGGYEPRRFDTIKSPELEHIAPRTPAGEEAAGYDKYDKKFVNEYIDCLGNYLLISKSHNCSIGNIPFPEKRDTYTHLFQQREIQEMTKDKKIWNKEKINERHGRIVNYIIKNL